ncbi:MAG: ABC transporter substrate-binding protein [Stackebrandtia sp.]
MTHVPLRRLALVAAAAATLLVGAVGCADGPQEVETPGGYTVTLVNPDKLTVCTHLPYVPFQYKAGDEIVGFDVDIVDLIAAELGLEQELVDMDFNQINNGAALSGNRCDLAAAGMTITDERAKNITFSDPYFDEVVAFLSPKGEPVESIEQVKEDELSLGVQASTTSLSYAKDNDVEPREFPDSAKQKLALESGQVDVILQDLPVLQEWLATDDSFAEDFELGGVIETGSHYGLGMKKDADERLVEVVNDVLAESKSNEKYDEIYARWFEAEAEAS